jgi:hypothetical protein
MTAPSRIDSARFLQLASASPDLLRSLLTMFVDALMSAEADAVCGAPHVAPRLGLIQHETLVGLVSYCLLVHRQVRKAVLRRPAPDRRRPFLLSPGSCNGATAGEYACRLTTTPLRP